MKTIIPQSLLSPDWCGYPHFESAVKSQFLKRILQFKILLANIHLLLFCHFHLNEKSTF